MNNKTKNIVVGISHLVIQIGIYGFLSYVHLWLMIFTLAFQSDTPDLWDFLYFQKLFLLPSLVIGIIFSLIWRNTWRFNAWIYGASILFYILYSIVMWVIYNQYAH